MVPFDEQGKEKNSRRKKKNHFQHVPSSWKEKEKKHNFGSSR